jgi:hypothetical protein
MKAVKLFVMAAALGLMALAGWSCEETARVNNGDGVGNGDGDADGDGDSDGTVAPRDTDIKEEICDANGNCYCLRLAVIGTSDSTANDTDVTAFVEWLNTKSSCSVTMFEERVTLTEAFLAEFDIVLFQLLADTANGPFWTYTGDEIAALRTWIEGGGGMITLTGYNGNMSAEEVATINGLLKPVTGISYNNDRYLAEACDTCWCWGNSVPIYGWNRNHEISKNISQVGALWGYSINAPEGAVVVATEGGRNAAVAMELGKGRVFAFADEWVIFTNQWRDGDTTPGGAADQYNVCYDMEEQQFNNAENYFQIPQFWYNVIGWVAPPNDCFIIEDPGVIV